MNIVLIIILYLLLHLLTVLLNSHGHLLSTAVASFVSAHCFSYLALLLVNFISASEVSYLV